MHGAYQVGNARIGYRRSAAFKFAFVGIRRLGLLAAAIRTRRSNGNTRPHNHLLFTTPGFGDFNTFNARIINGSTPFSISTFLLSSVMSTGTPLPS
jgi:hypothetical protein